jgi:hypothetical protein
MPHAIELKAQVSAPLNFQEIVGDDHANPQKAQPSQDLYRDWES